MSDNRAPAYNDDKDADMKSRSPSRSRSRSRSHSLSRSRSPSRSISRSPRHSPPVDNYVPPPMDGAHRSRSPGPNGRHNNRGPDRDVRDRRLSYGSRSRSRSLSFSRSRSYSRSPSRDRSLSRDRGPGGRSFSRSRSRSYERRRERSISRSPSPARAGDRSERGGRASRSRSYSRSPQRSTEPIVAGTEGVAKYIIVEGVPGGNVSKAHLSEIFGKYGDVVSVQFGADSPRAQSSGVAYLDLGTPEAAQKAKDYMDGGEIRRGKVKVTISTTGRPGGLNLRSGERPGRSGRRSGRSGRSGKNRDYRGGQRPRGPRDSYRADDRGRSPPRQGRGSRYARSPSPYRGRRMSRDRRSPVRSRSPYGRHHGGGSQRFQNRSPSPRYSGYRGGRYERSRSYSRSRR